MSFWVAVILSAAAGVSVLIALYQLYLPVKVLAPKKDIPAGVLIGQEDIGYVTMSRRDRHSLAVTDPEQVIGKYAKEKLYALEPILSQKITTDQKEIDDIKNSIGRDETYFALKQNEARWPPELKRGDSVTAVAVLEGGNPQIVGRKIRVLNAASSKKMSGTIDQIKNAVSPGNDNNITLALKWDQVGPFLFGKYHSKELWLLPDQEGAGPGPDIYGPEQPGRLWQALNNGKESAQGKFSKSR